ncbi:MAG: 1-phosphofructokinase [Eubacteriales bacterium]
MVVTVTLNPAIDRTIFINGYKPGGVHRVKESYEDVGGKGINVSKVINLLGGDTLATGFIGGNRGEKIRCFLNKEKIKEDFIDSKVETRMNVKIVDMENNATTEFNEKGMSITNEQTESLKNKIESYAKKAEFIVFGGSAPESFSLYQYEELIKIASRYTKIVIDAEGELLKKGLKTAPFMIKPNIDELTNSFGLVINGPEDIINASKKLIKEYKVKIILVSMGKEGSILVTKDQVIKAEPVLVDVKSTVSAGDSMVAGFLYKYEQDKDLIQGLRYGAACGTAAVTTEGTKLFSKEIFKSILGKLTIRTI